MCVVITCVFGLFFLLLEARSLLRVFIGALLRDGFCWGSFVCFDWGSSACFDWRSFGLSSLILTNLLSWSYFTYLTTLPDVTEIRPNCRLLLVTAHILKKSSEQWLCQEI